VIRQMRDTHGDEAVARSGLVYVAPNGAPDWRQFVHANARLIIPWRDPSGLVCTLQRRRIDDGKPKYCAATGRAPRWPYGVHHLAELPGVRVAIVEGAIDALALALLWSRRGIAAVPLGIQGVQGWRSTWATLARGRDAFVAFDADAAGEKAVAIVARDLGENGAITVQRLAPTIGKDWAEALEAA
jgi:DNA primase